MREIWNLVSFIQIIAGVFLFLKYGTVHLAGAQGRAHKLSEPKDVLESRWHRTHRALGWTGYLLVVIGGMMQIFTKKLGL